MNQREREQALDRFIDQLIAGDRPADPDDPELAALCAVVRDVRRQRAAIPTPDVESRLTEQVASRVRPSVPTVEPNQRRHRDAPPLDFPLPVPQPVRIDHAPHRHRCLRDIGQAVAAGLVLLLVGALLAALLGGRLRQDQTPQLGSQPSFNRLASTPPAMITLDDARRSVRAFLGEPNAALDGKLDTPESGTSPILFRPSPERALYLLTRSDEQTGTPDTFIVDANGGAVLRAILPSQAAGAARATPLSDDAAGTVAEQFARAHFSGQFDTLSLATYPYSPDHRYLIMDPDPATFKNYVEFSWRLHSTDNRWLPTWVSVDVDRTTGDVVQYVARASGTENIESPTVTQQQAEQIAIQHAAPDGNTSSITVTSAALMTTYWDQQTEIWVWAVELHGVPSEPDSNGTLSGVRINARTGAVVGDAMTLN